MLRLLFPPKCVLCRKLLAQNETDLCHDCRTGAPEFKRAKRNIPSVAQWTALWYYKENVRKSIHRFKFGNARGYADAYARQMALQLQKTFVQPFDYVTWVPISGLRYLKRGYDQSELLARAIGAETAIPVDRLLKKIRHTPPQSSFRDAAQRRANVMGVYRVCNQQSIAGKRVLLLDDVVTTGATASSCAQTLLIAGAKEVCFAAVAAAADDKNK